MEPVTAAPPPPPPRRAPRKASHPQSDAQPGPPPAALEQAPPLAALSLATGDENLNENLRVEGGAAVGEVPAVAAAAGGATAAVTPQLSVPPADSSADELLLPSLGAAQEPGAKAETGADAIIALAADPPTEGAAEEATKVVPVDAAEDAVSVRGSEVKESVVGVCEGETEAQAVEEVMKAVEEAEGAVAAELSSMPGFNDGGLQATSLQEAEATPAAEGMPLLGRGVAAVADLQPSAELPAEVSTLVMPSEVLADTSAAPPLAAALSPEEM